MESLRRLSHQVGLALDGLVLLSSLTVCPVKVRHADCFVTDQREDLAHSLTIFVPFWAQNSPQHAQNASRLELVQKHHSLIEDTPKGGVDESGLDVAAAMQIEAVLEIALMHTRAALFLFLNSLVCDPITLRVTDLTTIVDLTSSDR